MSKSIKEISNILEDFCVKRSWRNDDPNQLITSLIIEIGELSEHFQWQSKFRKLTKDEKLAIGFEFVDIINYLFRLAYKTGIDIEKYFDMKMEKLEKKFPIGQTTEEYRKVKQSYRKTGKNKLYD